MWTTFGPTAGQRLWTAVHPLSNQWFFHATMGWTTLDHQQNRRSTPLFPMWTAEVVHPGKTAGQKGWSTGPPLRG